MAYIQTDQEVSRSRWANWQAMTDSNSQMSAPDPVHSASTEMQVVKEVVGAFIGPLADAEKVKET